MTAMRRHTLMLPARLANVASVNGMATTADPTPAPTSAAKAMAEDRGWADFRTALDAALADIRAWRLRARDEVARLSVALAVAIAERLLANEIAADRQRLDRIVAKSLERLPAQNTVTVRGHPDDLSLLQRQLAASATNGESNDEIVCRADASLERGRLKLEAGDLFLEWNTLPSLLDLRELLLEDIVADE